MEHCLWIDPDCHQFFVPKRACWSELVMVQHLSKLTLNNANLAEPDMLERACEHLIEQFAEDPGKRGGEFCRAVAARRNASPQTRLATPPLSARSQLWDRHRSQIDFQRCCLCGSVSRVGRTGGERQQDSRPRCRRGVAECSSRPSPRRGLRLVLRRGTLGGWMALLALVAGGHASAQRLFRCVLDGGVLTGPQLQIVSVPAGCAVTFKVWGGGGGSCSRSGGQHGLGGGGGYATLRRTATIAEAYTLVVGRGGGAGGCVTPGPSGSSLDGFFGGAGGKGSGSPPNCAGGGGGGASLVLLGRAGASDPLLVAAGGGGSGASGADSEGRAGGLGPWVADGGAGGAGCSSTGGPGGGGGGGGHPLGGRALGDFYCVQGAGGQNSVPDGLSLTGSGREPGGAADPDRPADAGLGGAGSLAGAHGAIVYTISEASDSPSALQFPAVSGAPAEALIESEELTVTDFDAPALVRVVGAGAPELSVAGRPWIGSDVIAPGDTLRLRQLSSASPGQTHTALLLFGSLVTEWSVTTAPEPRAPPRRLQVGMGCRTAAPSQSASRADALLVFAGLGAALLGARTVHRGVRRGR